LLFPTPGQGRCLSTNRQAENTLLLKHSMLAPKR
jgi:hypothetical protein